MTAPGMTKKQSFPLHQPQNNSFSTLLEFLEANYRLVLKNIINLAFSPRFCLIT